jgi:hypothetical protein
MLVPKSLSALAELHRILLPGGVNGFTTWHTVGWFSILRRAFEAIPGCPPFPDEEKLMDFMSTGAWGQPEFIKKQLQEAGFVDVTVEVQRETARMESPRFFVSLFGDMFVSFAIRGFGEAEKAEFGPKIRETVLSQLEEEHGVGKSWDLPMTACVVLCGKPE